MQLTSRRPRPLDRRIPHLHDTRLVIIATEGECTEKQYFSTFERKSTRVQVRVLETIQGMSAPKHVLDRLRRYRREYELGPGDALCLVVDKDRWPDQQLSKVAAEAFRLHFELAVSRPCFEVWLYLHHTDCTPEMSDMTSQDIVECLRVLLGGYDNSNLRTELFEPHIDDAVRRAEALDVSPSDRWPNRLGTRVYRVIRAIRDRM
ncbi:MAG: RloB domain-containing protein [Acidobacteria bacterium]|nr:MAG: RloB domain-containing protein [Acidobacteriota bacterium]